MLYNNNNNINNYNINLYFFYYKWTIINNKIIIKVVYMVDYISRIKTAI
jgi:hypothetical protein